MATTVIAAPENSVFIDGALKYCLTPDGNVWREGKRLIQQFKNGKWYAQVYKDNGEKWVFDSTRLAESTFGEPPSEYLTREEILEGLQATIVPGFPRYATTHYGAIYCIDPPKRGPNAGRCYPVRATMKRDKSYVTLYRSDGSRKFLAVDTVVDLASGSL